MELYKRSPHLLLAVRALHVRFGALVIEMLSQVFDANWVLQFTLVEGAAALYYLSIYTVRDDMA